MFEHVVLRRAEGGLPISAGQLAEAMLYYQKVHLIIDGATLFNFINQLGTGRLLTILSRADVSAVYCEEILATQTETTGVSQSHNFVAMNISGHQGVGSFRSTQETLQFQIERQGVAKTEARQFTLAFLKRVPVRKISGNHFLPGGIPEAAKRDMLDVEYVRQAVRQAVAFMPGGYSAADDFKFDVVNSELGHFVFTDIDFQSINRRRAALIPAVESLTVAHLLTSILDARADLALASFYGGDFVTSNVTSAIIQVRYSELLRRSKVNVDSREQFTEVVLPDSPSLAEIIDSGERTFDEFLTLLDRASRFKDWLKAVNPDENLIRTYLRDISSEGWIQRLPAKSLRYMLTLGLDAVNPAVGLAAGFIDNFVVEKLLAGWRPNHFVSTKLVPFMNAR
jgi:hypothetical protein